MITARPSSTTPSTTATGPIPKAGWRKSPPLCLNRFRPWDTRSASCLSSSGPSERMGKHPRLITTSGWLPTPLHDGMARRAAPNGPRATPPHQKGRRTRPRAVYDELGPSHGSQAIASPAHAVNGAAAGSPRPTPAPTYGRQCGHRGPRCRWLANGQSKRDGRLRLARQNRRF